MRWWKIGTVLCAVALAITIAVLLRSPLVMFAFLHPKEAEIAAKGSLGESIFNHDAQLVPRDVLDLLLSPAATRKVPIDAIAQYRREPAKFKRYAEMFDTAVSAMQVGHIVLGRQQELHAARQSTDISFVATDIELDAWGRPFCVIPVQNGVAVVSGGASRMSLDCSQTQRRIIPVERMVYEDAAGQVVVFVTAEKARNATPVE